MNMGQTKHIETTYIQNGLKQEMLHCHWFLILL